MEKNTVIQNVICIAQRFYENGNTSIYNLLKDSGYFEMQKDITSEDLQSEFNKNQNCIDHWQRWSDSKRTDSGWFITASNDKYIISLSPLQQGITPTEFSNKIEAYANYIKLEIDDIKSS